MSIHRIINEAISPWMKQEGPDDDIVLSSRIRLARNFSSYLYPTLLSQDKAKEICHLVKHYFEGSTALPNAPFEYIEINKLEPVEKRVLIEKHLISPNLVESVHGACILSQNEQISIMINEEDHLRIQALYPGLQLREALTEANNIDNYIESQLEYAFDETIGYLTSCPTNVGTGLRASVMMHLPALVITKQFNRLIPTINQLGLVVRGIYGEGSEALGNIFQISNQITLGKSEEEIIEDLITIVQQLIKHEKSARDALVKTSLIRLEDRIYRSLGILKYGRIIETKESAVCLSDVQLGIDLGLITGLSKNFLNELMILTQPGILQQFVGNQLTPEERDIRRASLIREKLSSKNN
ncbi:protein arginine kinase [Gottfriedia solisilvae]|uniref:Protein-arginine kinase n=1 Tax=Gottfriedia solisilvae TaxID=1516104 RepID=A0A8J3ASU5_9BACI|nr:protein arginine kinase [Gottfriedia solisilvae]GGI18219.1 protein-arginine kinase [Gottfriedia solisilvae]